VKVIVTDDVAGAGADWIAALRPRTVALSGGNTPRGIDRELARRPLPWDAMDFYFGDERCVPPDDPQSNYRMAREALPLARLHRMEAERPDLEAAAADYARILPDVLDLIILGVGEDGHTASLFPGRPVGPGNVIVVRDAPKPPPTRLSVTPMVIRAARERLVVATGADKAEVVRAALTGPVDPLRLPVQHARDGTWLLDRAAAKLLEGQDVR